MFEKSRSTLGQVYSRIRLKYDKFQAGNGDRIRCTVLRFNYGIIRHHRWSSFTMLRKRTVYVPLSSFLNHTFLFRLIETSTGIVSVIFQIYIIFFYLWRDRKEIVTLLSLMRDASEYDIMTSHTIVKTP